MLSIKYKEQIKNVEEVLLMFPENCRSNFNINLKTLRINEDNSSTNVLGNYNPLENAIILYDDSSLCHELFHMAFNNASSYGKEVEEGLYIDNGIALKSENSIFGHALTEGFTEYLNRKCKSNEAKHFEYYFADLLISIYGEEILEYPLENNPIGFLEYGKFNNIVKYISNLDQLEELFKNVEFIAASRPLIKEATIKGDNAILNDFKELILSTKIGMSSVTLDLFNTIIDEYNSCEKPKIDIETFIEKVESFCQDKDYVAAFRVSSNNNLKNDILNLRTRIKETREKEI